MALQISKKRDKIKAQGENDPYKESILGNRRLQTIDLEAIQRYLIIEGMFEINDHQSFSPLDKNLNPDSQTWKKYDINFNRNKFELDEIKFDLDDVVLQGTSDSIEYMDQVVSRL